MRYACLTVLLLCWQPALLLGADAQDSPSGPAAEEVAEGFAPIFDGKSLDGWVGLSGSTDSYYTEDGMLICKATGKEHIFTEKEYGNFVLRLQIKMDPGGNNGVGVRLQAIVSLYTYRINIRGMYSISPSSRVSAGSVVAAHR